MFSCCMIRRRAPFQTLSVRIKTGRKLYTSPARMQNRENIHMDTTCLDFFEKEDTNRRTYYTRTLSKNNVKITVLVKIIQLTAKATGNPMPTPRISLVETKETIKKSMFFQFFENFLT